jgi:hypothetical protein
MHIKSISRVPVVASIPTPFVKITNAMVNFINQKAGALER